MVGQRKKGREARWQGEWSSRARVSWCDPYHPCLCHMFSYRSSDYYVMYWTAKRCIEYGLHLTRTITVCFIHTVDTAMIVKHSKQCNLLQFTYVIVHNFANRLTPMTIKHDFRLTTRVARVQRAGTRVRKIPGIDIPTLVVVETYCALPK